MRRGFSAFVLLLSVSWSLRAQEADTLSAAGVVAVQDRPVLKPAEEVRLDAQVAVPLLVADVLNRFTGVQVKDYGGVGGLKTINVRSLGSEHVGVFLDGIQIDNAQNMQVDLGRFSTDGLQSVSLYNGQKSSRLQTAKEYASGAAVYLSTAPRLHPDGGGGTVRLRGGYPGMVNPSVRWDKDLLPSLTLSLSTEFIYGDGRYRYPYFDTTLVRENGDIRSLRAELMLLGRHRGGDWRLHVYSYGSERGFPGPVIRRAAGFPFSAERQADQDIFVQGSWTQEWTRHYATAVRMKYANNYIHYCTHPEKNPMALPYDLHYRQQSGYFSLAQSVTLTEVWGLDLSTDIQYNALDSDVGQFVTPRRTTFTGALATRLSWEKVRFSAQVVYQGAWDVFKTPDAGGWSRRNAFRDAWMPSVSLSWQPIPSLEVDAFFKRTFRLPTFNDLYYSLIGNASLRPESALQCGMDVRFAQTWGHWHLDARVSPYFNRVSDKILAIPTASQFRWSMLNIGTADITGLELRSEAGWASGDWDIRLTGRYTFQSALDHSTRGSQTWGNQLPYIPRHSGSLSLLVCWRRWSLSTDSIFTGERWARSANIADYHIDPWSVTDLSLQRTFALPRIGSRTYVPNLVASIRGTNLFNYRYQIVQGYPMPGIGATASLAFNW